MKISFVLVLAGIALSRASYDYGDVLRKSLLFYEAQRSGKLPADQKVKWRHDSALDDKGENGEDLTGGYYDAGDYVKFGFPQAFTTTLLAWGLISHENGYAKAGALDDGRKAVKWATDYFLKCHVSKNTFYGQVGNSKKDHDFWGRPEDMKMERPAYKIDEKNPGSDLAAETAAALAAASIVFKKVDSSYSDTLVTHAKQLYDFADKYHGKYSDSIEDAHHNYKSDGYEDELVWGALWLYQATGDDSYLSKAEDMYKDFKIKNNDGFDWNQKASGVKVLLAKLTGKSKYTKKVQKYCDDMIHEQKRTPQGIIFVEDWGSLPSVANMAYLCLEAANMGINPDDYRKMAKEQIGYILGDTGRSFVVGFGENPPTHPHHASSDCPDAPAHCGWKNFDSSKPNAHILYGALVAGPDKKGKYKDDRDDFVHNEVADDYNAGFQSLLASLNDL